MDHRYVLRRLLYVAIEAALPSRVLPPYVAGIVPPDGRTVVVGAGKASAAMAAAFEACWEGPLSGVVSTRYGHAVPCERVRILEAAHPVPDEAAADAAREAMSAVEGLTSEDLVVGLFSGGGSSLLALPGPRVGLADKQRIARELLRSGASIAEINAVRKRLSAVKGGRLALASAPARVVTLVVSDVAGDDPSTVASGPTVVDRSTLEEALEVLARYRIDLDPSLLSEPPLLEEGETHVVACGGDALLAAAREAEALGLECVVLGEVEGDARQIAEDHARMAMRLGNGRDRSARAFVLLSGGETTVAVRGGGQGGRNVQYLTALALALDGQKGVYALAADTDGIDGTNPVAGAFIDPTTVQRAEAIGMPLRSVLADNDAHSLFSRLGDEILTGPTLTNVNDFRAILIV